MEIMDKKKRDELMVKLYSVYPTRISMTIAIHQRPKLHTDISGVSSKEGRYSGWLWNSQMWTSQNQIEFIKKK